MAKIDNVAKKMCSIENIMLAIHKATVNKSKNNPHVRDLLNHKEERASELQYLLKNKLYTTGEYHEFVIMEPKERKISALNLWPDRVVHHAIMNILEKPIDKYLIPNTFCCRKGKGIHAASKMCRNYAVHNKYYIRYDLRKFYERINHDLLKKAIRKKINDPLVLYYLDDIIDSTGTDTGIVIGNYTSQWLGNLFLSDMDRFITEKCKNGKYVRYCDDFVIFGNDIEKLLKTDYAISEYVSNVLEMEFSYHSEIQETKNGVKYVGYIHYKNGKVKVVRKTLNRMLRRYRKLTKQYNNGDITAIEYLGFVASAYGWISHANSRGIIKEYNLKRVIKEMHSVINMHKDKQEEIVDEVAHINIDEERSMSVLVSNEEKYYGYMAANGFGFNLDKALKSKNLNIVTSIKDRNGSPELAVTGHEKVVTIKILNRPFIFKRFATYKSTIAESKGAVVYRVFIRFMDTWTDAYFDTTSASLQESFNNCKAAIDNNSSSIIGVTIKQFDNKSNSKKHLKLILLEQPTVIRYINEHRCNDNKPISG